MQEIFKRVKTHTPILKQIDSIKRNALLYGIAEHLDSDRQKIKTTNQIDIRHAMQNGLNNAIIDLLRLDDKQIDSMISALHEIAAQPEVIGEVISGSVRPSGIRILKVRVPLYQVWKWRDFARWK